MRTFGKGAADANRPLERRKMELPVRYLFAALLWVLWCALHSTLVATTVTDYMRKKLGD